MESSHQFVIVGAGVGCYCLFCSEYNLLIELMESFGTKWCDCSGGIDSCTSMYRYHILLIKDKILKTAFLTIILLNCYVILTKILCAKKLH